MSFLRVFLVVCFVSFCYGIPTEEQILSAIDRTTVQNALRRGVDNLFGRNAEPAVNSCPHMMAKFHGKRSSADKTGDKRANDLISAAQMLLNEGHSLEDLQHENVKRVFQRQTTNCPTAPTCPTTASSYRSADGSCNNLANPGWGQAGQTQSRLVQSAYDDGISNPRKKSVLGNDLPNPRTVSNEVHAAPRGEEIRSNTITLHTFQMGQFLDHDIIATPTQSVVTDCCTTTAETDIGNCYSIIIPGSDRNFGDRDNDYCMNFHRSSPIFCPTVSAQREQQNVITSFIDASNVYGSSEAEMTALRDNGGTGALLATETGDRLPNYPEGLCIPNDADGIHCSLAGDHRVNVVPSLTTYHTLFVREHNRIATALREFYSDDETLFQETRKIVIGVMQKIVYDEFLPAFLSQDAMTKYKLSSSNDYVYDATMNPTVSNGFGIAYRFGHTWIPRNMDVFQRDLRPFLRIRTEDTYLRPDVTYIASDPNNPGSVNGMEGLAYWLTAVGSPETDRFIENAARNLLFTDGSDAFDLAALNIQRGRDHGLPSYNEYRKVCGLTGLNQEWSNASSQDGGLTNHDSEIITALRAVYESPQDIDLFTGALTESPSSSTGSVGPTLDCILGDQFMKLKYGDRFWYQGQDNGFSAAQQAEIQAASMARILCDNLNFQRVHSNAFLSTNLVRCDTIGSLDLTKFAPPTPAPPPQPTPAPTNPPNGGGGNPPNGGGGNGGGGRQGGRRPGGRPNNFEQLLEELLNELQ